ncbi:Crp/Fnr family transcriptional regulator [soil metagenome]
MSRLLIASVDRFGPLQNDVRDGLGDLAQDLVTVGAGQVIVPEGAPSRLRLLSRGIAVRQHVLADGGRQILGFAVPGDLLDLSGLFTGVDHEVRALGPCEVRQVAAHEVRFLIRRHPSLLAALCRAVMTEGRMQRNWMVGLGRRTALSRTANLLCEIYARQAVVALALESRCPFPALQADIADALGLSAVHTHRVLRTLTKMGLATVREGYLTIHDWDGLAALAEFDPEGLRPMHDPRAAAAARLGPTPEGAARIKAAVG